MRTKSFPAALRKRMTAAGLSAVALARKSGVAEASISRYLSGETFPNGSNLVALAKALRVKVEVLL